jgi:hypothetical protein
MNKRSLHIKGGKPKSVSINNPSIKSNNDIPS